MIEKDRAKTERIRTLNDCLRKSGHGGRIMVAASVNARGPEFVLAALRAVAAFCAFTPNNDPYGEHDCAIVDFQGESLLWKIDYYDGALAAGSPDPSDPTVTQRVLTLMFAEDY